MSCWVVPSVAAEMWGLTINQILERVRDGQVPSKLEMGFLMVDIASGSAAETPRVSRINRPPTYVTLGPQEERELSPVMVLAGDDEETDSFCIDWRQKRMAASLLRRRPAA
ncbi:MAG: hypothetical protein ABSH20_01990 [Tepidisphaeraceae bacterium]|jgi:hypothetical protein